MSGEDKKETKEQCIERYADTSGKIGTGVGALALGAVGAIPVVGNVTGVLTGAANGLMGSSAVVQEGYKQNPRPADGAEDAMNFAAASFVTLGTAVAGGFFPVASNAITGGVIGKHGGEAVGELVGKLACANVPDGSTPAKSSTPIVAKNETLVTKR